MFQYVKPEANETHEKKESKGESETVKKVREVVEAVKKILNERRLPCIGRGENEQR